MEIGARMPSLSRRSGVRGLVKDHSFPNRPNPFQSLTAFSQPHNCRRDEAVRQRLRRRWVRDRACRAQQSEAGKTRPGNSGVAPSSRTTRSAATYLRVMRRERRTRSRIIRIDRPGGSIRLTYLCALGRSFPFCHFPSTRSRCPVGGGASLSCEPARLLERGTVRVRGKWGGAHD